MLLKKAYFGKDIYRKEKGRMKRPFSRASPDSLIPYNTKVEVNMTPFYTNIITEQAESNIFSNRVVTRIDKSLVNKENLSKNNSTIISTLFGIFNSNVKDLRKYLKNIGIIFYDFCCLYALKCVSCETFMQKGSHEEPLNYHILPGQ
jgi:hypothetical protein